MRRDAAAPRENVSRAKVDLKLMPPPQPMIKRGKVNDAGGLQIVNTDDPNQQLDEIKPDLPAFEEEGEAFQKRDIPDSDANVRKTLEKIESDLDDGSTKEEKTDKE